MVRAARSVTHPCLIVLTYISIKTAQDYKLFLKNNKQNEEKIKELARKSGFHSVRYAGKWHDCKVYEPIFTDGQEHCIGYHQYIIEETDELRWQNDWEESLAVMDALGGDEDEN